jgi:hypothetical protein
MKTAPIRVAQVAVVALVSWAFTPQSVLPTLISVALLIWLCVDLIRHRTTRLKWVLLLALTYLAAGTAHDATTANYASAECADGTYSYSAHRSGTCFWHHGLASWHPRIPPWWKRLK